MVEKIKELRISIDGLSQLIIKLMPIIIMPNLEYVGDSKSVHYMNSNEIKKAYDSLIFAKAWSGKLMSELGEATPYANDGKRKDVKDIEPTADVATRFAFSEDGSVYTLGYENKNHIEKVDWLRQEISTLVEVSKLITIKDATREFAIARTNIYTHLCEARFWLGFELQRIREEKKYA